MRKAHEDLAAPCADFSGDCNSPNPLTEQFAITVFGGQLMIPAVGAAFSWLMVELVGIELEPFCGRPGPQAKS